MHVQNGTALGPRAIEHKVQAGLSRGLALAANSAAIGIHFQQAAGVSVPLSRPLAVTRMRPSDAHAEVAAGRRNPALRVAPARRRAQRSISAADIGAESVSGTIRIRSVATAQARPLWRILIAGRFYNESLLAEDQRDRLDVVLVSPRNPLNIGAVARAMANFGFSRLAVVAPYAPHWREARSAVGAPELLRKRKRLIARGGGAGIARSSSARER